MRVKLNHRNIGLLLKSRKVEDELARRAENIARTAGPGHTVDSSVGRNRARASVVTDDFDAILAEHQDRNLTRAFDAGRR